MKPNRIEHHGHRGLWVTLGVFAVSALVIGGVLGYGKLRALYLEQCIITDFGTQVTITSGKMVKPDVLAENFGLRNGTNLALIDFETKRRDILRRIPTLLSLDVTRQLPNRVTIRAEERTPVARMNVVGNRSVSGRVVDAEGMVFHCQRGTQSLPMIREPRHPGTAAGVKVKERTRAALELVMACREPDFADLGLLEVDTSKADFLLATIGDYSRVKICWDGMDETSPSARAALYQRLGNLVKIIRNKQGLRAVIWNATLPDYIFADTQERF